MVLGADEPLSLISNDDPGYETVRQVDRHLKLNSTERPVSINESSSEHDPNYETLLPNSTTSGTVSAPVKSRPQSRRFGDDEEDDGYSKIKAGGQQPVVVLKKVTTTSSCTDHEGYSSIRNIPNEGGRGGGREEDENEPGYSQIGIAAKLPTHGYASIDEAKNDQLEGYSTIPGMMTTSVTSVTTTNSSISPVSPIGYFPAPSAETSSYSSPSSEFSLSEMNLNRISAPLAITEAHNYESLTSDDPNYETVRHLRITENPYEVLENEPGTPASVMPIMGASDREGKDLVTIGIRGLEVGAATSEDRTKVSPSDSPEVGDYFQV